MRASPAGTAEIRLCFNRPFGTHGFRASPPNAEALGYGQRCLRHRTPAAAPGRAALPTLKETARWGQRALPVPLVTLGACNAVFVVLGALAAGILWRRVKRNGLARTGTWDCGYAQPTARMQYTAGSFAGIITEWFNWILCPERHGHDPKGVFPGTANRTSHTPETVLEKIVSPIGAAVMVLSTTVRRLQHGRLQMYILYLVIGLLALALLALFGGKL